MPAELSAPFLLARAPIGSCAAAAEDSSEQLQGNCQGSFRSFGASYSIIKSPPVVVSFFRTFLFTVSRVVTRAEYTRWKSSAESKRYPNRIDDHQVRGRSFFNTCVCIADALVILLYSLVLSSFFPIHLI